MGLTIAQKNKKYLTLIECAFFRALHDSAFKIVSKEIQSSNTKTLCQIGVGPVFAPYGYRLSRLTEMVGPDLRIIGIDKDSSILTSAAATVLTKNKDPLKITTNITDWKHKALENYKDTNIPYEAVKSIKTYDPKNRTFHPLQMPKSSITLIQNDIRKGLKIESESVDCVDSTLTLHHVGQYGELLDEALKEIHRILRPGGMFYYGTAFVDMTWPEAKLKMLAENISKIVDDDVTIIDKRSYITYYLHGTQGCTHLDVELKKRNPKKGTVLRINNESLIEIPDNISKEQLIKKGYFSFQIEGDKVYIPLIDHGMQEDKAYHIIPVSKFYKKTKNIVEELKGTKAEPHGGFIDSLLRDVDDETKDAINAREEHYRDEKGIQTRIEKIFGKGSYEIQNYTEDILPEGAQFGAFIVRKNK